MIISPKTNLPTVLIPLLLDDPLWELLQMSKVVIDQVLIPLLLDDPLWATLIYLVVTFVES